MPVSFEVWLAQEYPEAEHSRGTCQSCGAKARELVEQYCSRCLGYQYGYDEAQEGTLAVTIGGSIKAALAQEVPEQEVRAAVEDAFRSHHGDQYESVVRRFAEVK